MFLPVPPSEVFWEQIFVSQERHFFFFCKLKMYRSCVDSTTQMGKDLPVTSWTSYYRRTLEICWWVLWLLWRNLVRRDAEPCEQRNSNSEYRIGRDSIDGQNSKNRRTTQKTPRTPDVENEEKDKAFLPAGIHPNPSYHREQYNSNNRRCTSTDYIIQLTPQWYHQHLHREDNGSRTFPPEPSAPASDPYCPSDALEIFWF